MFKLRRMGFNIVGVHWLFCSNGVTYGCGRKNGRESGPLVIPLGQAPLFEHWQQDVSMRYVKNENYWREGYPYLDAIEYLFIYDRNTSANAFKAGEAHVLFMPILPLTVNWKQWVNM